jgi:hypothetical protein
VFIVLLVDLFLIPLLILMGVVFVIGVMMSMLEKGRLRLSVISVLKNIAVNIKKQK